MKIQVIIVIFNVNIIVFGSDRSPRCANFGSVSVCVYCVSVQFMHSGYYGGAESSSIECEENAAIANRYMYLALRQQSQKRRKWRKRLLVILIFVISNC